MIRCEIENYGHFPLQLVAQTNFEFFLFRRMSFFLRGHCNLCFIADIFPAVFGFSVSLSTEEKLIIMYSYWKQNLTLAF